MPRFSVRMLLIGVAVAAVAVFALLNASGGWARMIFAAAVVANTVTLIGALTTRRPGFVGFALAGWVYLLLSSSPILGPRAEWLQPGLQTLAPLRTRIERPVPSDQVGIEDGWGLGADFIRGGYDPVTGTLYLVPTPRHMQQVAHGLCCLAAGGLGAVFAVWLTPRQAEE